MSRLALWLALSAVGAGVLLWASGDGFTWLNPALWAGLWLGSGAAWLLDAHHWRRLREWLGQNTRTELPASLENGPAAAASNRIRRLLQRRDRDVEAAKAQLAEFLAAIQVSPNGVVLLSADARIEWCNTTAAHHFGLQLERDVAQLVGNLIRNPDFQEYLLHGDYAREAIIEPRSATRLAVQLHRYAHGRMLMLSRDVTAIEQAAQMRRDFVANVSHEIRTPLTVLHGFIETLQNLTLSAQEQQRYLALMAQQSQRMQDLVTDLLALSKLESLPNAPFDPAFSLRESLLKIEQQIQQIRRPDAILTINSAPNTQNAMLLGVESEIVSALTNLLTNAVRYSPPDAPIELRIETQAHGGLSLSVIDQGPGIEAHHLPRLTERFYRVDAGRSREAGGTGLGLAIVKTVMLRHGGQLQIDSAVGQGSCFTLVLPANRVVVPQ